MKVNKLKIKLRLLFYLKIIFILIFIISTITLVGTSIFKYVVNTQVISQTSKTKLEKPLSFLLIGADVDEGDIRDVSKWGAPRGDSMMLATVSPNNSRGNIELNVTSIPRDTEMYIPCANGFDKANSAMSYAYEEAQNYDQNITAGSECSVLMVEKYFGVDIDYYLTANFVSVINLIDRIDGIKLFVPYEFCEQNSKGKVDSVCLEEGLQKLDGEQALAYARQRKIQGDDWERSLRQQEIVGATLKKIISDPASYANEVGTSISKDMNTNINLSLLPDLLNFGVTSLNNIIANFSMHNNVNIYVKEPQFSHQQFINPVTDLTGLNLENIESLDSMEFYQEQNILSENTSVYNVELPWSKYNIASSTPNDLIKPINIELQFTTLGAVDNGSGSGNLYLDDLSRYYYGYSIAKTLNQETKLVFDSNYLSIIDPY